MLVGWAGLYSKKLGGGSVRAFLVGFAGFFLRADFVLVACRAGRDLVGFFILARVLSLAWPVIQVRGPLPLHRFPRPDQTRL
jgi:hypothetical protein